MDAGTARASSALLVRHWREGSVLAALPAAGYLIQAQIDALSARPLFGWKIAATSEAGQRHIGVESSPAFVRAPERNGCAERFIRTL